MAWTIEYSDTALKQLGKLDRQTAAQILDYMRDKVLVRDDPRTLGKPLRRELGGLWRYRVQDQRVICEIQDNKVKILVVRLGNRRDVYDK